MRAAKYAAIYFLLALAGNAALQFVGVLSIGGNFTFAVMDGDAPPKWMRIGQEISGYRIATYREKDEVLVLKSDTAALELKLRDSKEHPKTSGFTCYPPEAKKPAA
jgi:hypothetical protein